NWGGLTEAQVVLTSTMLVFYSLSVVTQSVNTIMNRAYYSTKNSILPFLAGSVGIVMNFVLAYAVTVGTGLGAAGVALAYTAATIFITAGLLAMFRKRIPGFRFINSPGFIQKTIIAAVIMGVVLIVADRYLMTLIFKEGIMGISKSGQALWVGMEMAAGLGVYCVVSYAFRIDEMRQIVTGISNKIKAIAKN
ncbi:MAG: polysaccharide biosynthesis C-terminal domain-containing protein, partial [Clostridia bacterium]|nr:polysaccharide biosynthesis C-terminal domain-containing protein [Clostridia bacterium]